MPVYPFLRCVLQIIFISSILAENLVDFGGNQKFFATNFDRDAVETTVNEHSTSASTSKSQRGQHRAYNSILDTPQTEWMSTTTVPSHEPSESMVSDHPLESQSEEKNAVGEKPPTKEDDFVLVFSHAIEIPLSRTPPSVLESKEASVTNEASASFGQSSISSEDRAQTRQAGESNRQQSQQEINAQKVQLLAREKNYQEKRYQEVPVIFQTIPASSYEAPDPYVRDASPSQPLVRMYSYLAPSASASNDQTQYQHYIPPSSYRPEQTREQQPVQDRPRKYQSMEQPLREQLPNKVVRKPPSEYSASGGNQPKFIPLSAPYRAPVMPFFPSFSQSLSQFGMPRHNPLPSLQTSSQNLPHSFFPQSLNQIMTAESMPPQAAPITSPSSPIRSLANIPFFPRLFQLHQLLGGRRWL